MLLRKFAMLRQRVVIEPGSLRLDGAYDGVVGVGSDDVLKPHVWDSAPVS